MILNCPGVRRARASRLEKSATEPQSDWAPGVQGTRTTYTERMPGRRAPQNERREQILEAALRVAIRHRLAGLTIREVARVARLSTGLVLFHFKTRDDLVEALLERLLREPRLFRHTAAQPSKQPPGDRLRALIRIEAVRLATNRTRTELFFEYWVLGSRMGRIRRRMREAVVAYQQGFRDLAEQTLHRLPREHRAARAESMADAAVAFVFGCAIQAVIDPEHFHIGAPLKILHINDQSSHRGGGSRLRRPRRSDRARRSRGARTS